MIKEIFNYLKKLYNSNKEDKSTTEIDFVPLIVYLRRKIKQTDKSEGVKQKLESFLKLSIDDQIEQFPACYLLIEKYLLEIEKQYDSSQQVIRRKIVELFPDQVSISPNVQIIFQSRNDQELFLKNKFALLILDASIGILGAKGDSHLINLRDAFLFAKTKNYSITPKLYSLMNLHMDIDICSFYKKTFQKIYDEISDYLGESAATRLFEKQYQKLASSFSHLQSFAMLIDILPGKVLDEEKINILSRSQIENLLIGKIKSLEKYNEDIHNKNIELEVAQKEIVELNNEYKRSSNQFSTVLETIAQGIITFDNTGIIILVNKRLEEMWGFNRTELIGKSIENLFLPESLNHILYNSDKNRPQLNLRTQIEVNALRKNGTMFPAEMSLSSFYLNKGIFFTAAIHDITMKKAEEQQVEDLMNKIKRNNLDLKNYARVVSHDIKTPIRGIKNICEWLNEDNRDQLDESGKKYLDLLQTKVQHMEQLVEGILAYSKAGIENSNLELINVDHLLQETIELISPPQNISIELQENLPEIYAEGVKLRQVFQNLITNAIKYNDKEKGIIYISYSQDELYWYFSVADNGIGIEKKFFDKIFEVFQTLHPTDRFDSTGIGLSIVKKIVEQHKGTIEVESQPGVGSTFSFSIYKKLKEEKIKY